ncbi:MAG: tRNA lysidine(34) synthetase TilS [Actinomycetes bacterium]
MARRALGADTLAVVQAVAALPPGPWVVACSGGADSLALAWAAGHAARARGTRVRGVVIDHGLQTGSDARAAAVVSALAGFGMVADAVRVDVASAGSGLEAAAREARYAALAAAAQPGELVLLGHTLDDQAETVLLGLARGSGVRSLGGMPAARGPFRRPMLGIGREVTRGACGELSLDPWEDPMNADRRFARVRVREVVLPVMEAQLGPGIREALARTARLSAEASAVLDAAAAAEAPATAGDCAALRGLAPALRRSLVTGWLRREGARDVSAAHVDAVERLVTHWHGQRGVDVPGGRVRRADGMLHFESR